MQPNLRYRLDQLSIRLHELEAILASPEVSQDMKQFRKLNKEHADITPLVALFNRFVAAENDAQSARDMLSDPDMKEFAQDELQVANETITLLERELEIALLPKDQDDERNVILEIRAGTGGDEAALFAGDLLRMYLRFAERCGWRTEVMSQSEGDVGGYKEVIIRIEGTNVYSRMKFESGGHRVQRVPETETQGRIHTSACTVAVMAEADEIEDVQINPSELRIDTFRASGAGGQHINKTDSAVRIVHIPSGITVECQDDRSQHRNRDRAMKILVTRIRDVQERQAHAKEAAERKSLIGTGDRSGRIRTYNFPQGRMTDHRINLTMYKLSFIMDGDIEEMISALVSQDQADKLALLASQPHA